MSVASTCKTIIVLGVVSLLALYCTCIISFTPKQLKLINNPLCYLTDQINIPEVELT